jgi:hypothetical protein
LTKRKIFYKLIESPRPKRVKGRNTLPRQMNWLGTPSKSLFILVDNGHFAPVSLAGETMSKFTTFRDLV